MEINRDLKFNYNPETFLVYPDKPFALLDKYRYDLFFAPIVKEGVVYLATEDLKRVYSGTAVVPDNDAEAIREDGTEYVPVISFLARNLKLKCTVSQGRLVFAKNSVAAGRFENLWWDLYGRDKDWGDLYRVFWFEPLHRLIPYRLYVPTWYDGTEDMKLLCLLHGGGSNTDEAFESTGNRLQVFAEKLGYICLSIDAALADSTYGCLLLPEGADIPGLDYSCKENPLRLSETSIAYRKLAEESVIHVIDMISRIYRIDPDRRYLFGNSMGGMGTFHIPAEHPGIFRAIAPAGAAPDMRGFEYEKLKGLPILLIAGTEDYHGFDYIRNAYRITKEAGLDIRFLPVGGGHHEDCYKEVLQELFDFFEENC
ncbi:MAG: hypothetical protein K6E19_04130 [Lachnospiraceae bacterium]|nr:hypothetical protein [Lachnospiraceae bacterium]